MAIKFGDSIGMTTRKQNVERDAFETIEDMKNYRELFLPPIFHAMCEEDGCMYIYNVNNEVNPTTGKWRKFTGGGGGGVSLEEDIVANVAVGNAPVGTVFAAGDTFADYIKKVHVATLPPAVSITSPSSTTKEVGEVITTLPIKAKITRKTYTVSKVEFFNNNVSLNTITGIPEDGLVQMDYECNNNDTNMTIKVVASDSNGLTGKSSVDVKFSRGIFYGTSTGSELYNTSALVRGLSNKELGKVKGYKFSITIPVGSKSVIIAIPSTLGSIADIKFRESMNLSVLASFNVSTVDVEGANGYTATSYKVYQYVAASSFSQLSHYDVEL